MTTTSSIRREVLVRMAGGLAVVTVPVVGWWIWARRERAKIIEQVKTKVRIPGVDDTYDYLIAEKCQAGDVLLFDRRCERCAASPWAALACWTAQRCLTQVPAVKSYDAGHFDHVALIVPGYVRSRADAYDPTNLLVLEATAGAGIVARPLKERLEMSASRSILLLPLCCPGEQRSRSLSDDDNDDDDNDDEPKGGRSSRTTPAAAAAAAAASASSSQLQSVERTRAHVEKELSKFRDTWTALSDQRGYAWIHATLTLGGALTYATGWHDRLARNTGLAGTHTPAVVVSPAAYLVLQGLQQAAAAPQIPEREQLAIKPEDFLRDYRFEEKNAVRLRPGWRFLAPVPLKETSRS